MATYRVISADSHIVEPGDLWQRHIDPAYRDRAPRMVRENETDWIVCEGTRLGPPFGYSTAGNKRPVSRTFDAVYRGAYDPTARLADMGRDGIDAEVVYPSVAMRAFNIPDAGLRRATLEAYNRWITAFSSVHPKKIKGLGMVDVGDPVEAEAMLRRAHTMGLVGALITIETADPDRYASPALDRFWHAAEELNVPLSLHILTNEKPIQQGAHIAEILQHGYIQQALTTMVFGGVFQRHPGLRVVSAETDAGWAPYLMERMDYIYSDPRRQTYQNYPIKGGAVPPSEYLKRNVYFTFMRDASAVYVRDLIGPSHLMWASDYPHNDSTWPRSQEVIDRLCAGIPDKDRQAIVADNAASFYGFN